MTHCGARAALEADGGDGERVSRVIAHMPASETARKPAVRGVSVASRWPSVCKVSLHATGQGNLSGMHGPMLENLGRALELDVREENTVWESLALANLMVAMAANRHYAYQSIGALGAIELTAPGRSEHVNAALKRLGLGGEARRYYALHATLDLKHSRAWNSEVLQPLVAADPTLAKPIAEGALMRLRSGARCFERYRSELWSGNWQPGPAPRSVSA